LRRPCSDFNSRDVLLKRAVMPFVNNITPTDSSTRPSDQLQSSHNLTLSAEDSRPSLRMNLQYSFSLLVRVLTCLRRQIHFFKAMTGITSMKCTLHGEKIPKACMSPGITILWTLGVDLLGKLISQICRIPIGHRERHFNLPQHLFLRPREERRV
jgi:hypothetical protein